jgi:hypothetical protein
MPLALEQGISGTSAQEAASLDGLPGALGHELLKFSFVMAQKR